MTSKRVLLLSAFILVGAFCLAGFLSSAAALTLGAALSLIFGNPFLKTTKQMTGKLLSYSIMGLGAGMNLHVVAEVGLHGIAYTAVGISMTLVLAALLGKLLKTSPGISTLIGVGTAICGGSAIAAVAPVIRAKDDEFALSLATVFLLNASALLIFPVIGARFHLSQEQFGLWAALAIHDTSSVVGACLQYGSQALQIGTTVKLARALWIVPVTLFFAWIRTKSAHESESAVSKTKKPWFILGFLGAAAIVTYIPGLTEAGHVVENVARRALVLTLFLIGAGVTRETLAAVGFRPMLQAIVLWLVVGTTTFMLINAHWIAL